MYFIKWMARQFIKISNFTSIRINLGLMKNICIRTAIEIERHMLNVTFTNEVRQSTDILLLFKWIDVKLHQGLINFTT